MILETSIAARIGPEPYADLLTFPRFFEIETVNACNAACPMCTIGDWNRKDGVMKDGLFHKIAYELAEHAAEVQRVHLYRDGEPLLDKRLGIRIHMLKSIGIKKVGISTNAALLDQAHAEAILDGGLDECILSIDSLHPKVYEKIRVGLVFDEVLKNCINFISTRDLMKSKCRIRIRMIRQQENASEWPEYERFWRTIAGPNDTVEYKNIHNWGGQLVNFRPMSQHDPKPCIALWSLMVIFADGTVPRCNADYNALHKVGNVRETSISDLWRSQTQQDVRAEHLAGKPQSICNGCTVWP